jgi:hypothetical protein
MMPYVIHHVYIDMPADVHAALEKTVWQFHSQFCESIGVPLGHTPSSLQHHDDE